MGEKKNSIIQALLEIAAFLNVLVLFVKAYSDGIGLVNSYLKPQLVVRVLYLDLPHSSGLESGDVESSPIGTRSVGEALNGVVVLDWTGYVHRYLGAWDLVHVVWNIGLWFCPRRASGLRSW